MKNHPCDECGKYEATVHYTQLGADQKVKEVHLCQACAEKQGEKAWVHISSLADLLAGLRESDEPASNREVCPQCGMSSSEFRKRGKLGCGQCYETFAKELEPLIMKMHGSTSHVGSGPKEVLELRDAYERLAEFRRQLSDAVANEAYEEAARLRDDIKMIEETYGFLAERNDLS